MVVSLLLFCVAFLCRFCFSHRTCGMKWRSRGRRGASAIFRATSSPCSGSSFFDRLNWRGLVFRLPPWGSHGPIPDPASLSPLQHPRQHEQPLTPYRELRGAKQVSRASNAHNIGCDDGPQHCRKRSGESVAEASGMPDFDVSCRCLRVCGPSASYAAQHGTVGTTRCGVGW